MCIYDTSTYDCGARKYHLAQECNSPLPCQKHIRWHEAKAGLCEECTKASFGCPIVAVWNPFYPPQNSCGQSGFLVAALSMSEAEELDERDVIGVGVDTVAGTRCISRRSDAHRVKWKLSSESDEVSDFDEEEDVWFDAEEYH